MGKIHITRMRFISSFKRVCEILLHSVQHSSAMISQIDQAVSNLETMGLYPDINKDDKWKIVASAFLDFIKHHRNYYGDLVKKS